MPSTLSKAQRFHIECCDTTFFWGSLMCTYGTLKPVQKTENTKIRIPFTSELTFEIRYDYDQKKAQQQKLGRGFKDHKNVGQRKMASQPVDSLASKRSYRRL
ncbi:hypothetical protein PoB_003918800 [Plakobranchus ocellatus]|uniref:Uncharacterized protein n=1 Tax=Plakobranchus ocellatus TaxID=259542 RepID=A0AAV4AZD7_9GAST|nr:hypothetical protein PoB_003918800 [Plakobranchus ocellatus]